MDEIALTDEQIVVLETYCDYNRPTTLSIPLLPDGIFNALSELQTMGLIRIRDVGLGLIKAYLNPEVDIRKLTTPKALGHRDFTHFVAVQYKEGWLIKSRRLGEVIAARNNDGDFITHKQVKLEDLSDAELFELLSMETIW